MFAALLFALCTVESGGNPNAIHHDDGGSDSIGYCQIKEATARSVGFRGKREDLFSQQVNFYYAGLYLERQLERFGTVERALSAYNAGHPVRSNRAYVRRVLRTWRQR